MITASEAYKKSTSKRKELYSYKSLMAHLEENILNELENGNFKAVVYISEYADSLIDRAISDLAKDGYSVYINDSFLNISWKCV